MRTGVVRYATDGAYLSIRVTPKSSQDLISGFHVAADGAMSLAVKVSAAPDMGRANGAVVEVLAKAFRVPKSRIAIVSGETNRNKIVFVSGDTAVLAAGITEFLEDLGKKGIEDGKDH